MWKIKSYEKNNRSDHYVVGLYRVDEFVLVQHGGWFWGGFAKIGKKNGAKS